MRHCACALFAVVCGLSMPALGVVEFVSQSNVAAISFSQPDFSDARIDGANTFGTTATVAGDVRRITWTWGGEFDRRVESAGGVVVDGIQTTGDFAYNVRHPTGAPGSHTFFYSRTQPAGQAFFASTVNGVPRLHYLVTSSSLVFEGSGFSWVATIPGDWSSLGNGPGQAELVSLNAGWTVTQNFVFDGTLTRIAFERQPGVAGGPGAVMNFYGVPAPGGVAMLGVMALRWGKRRRATPV